MPKRTICISRHAHLSLSSGSLVIKLLDEGDIVSIPMEDIWAVILENGASTITSAAMEALMDSGAAVMTCGQNGEPNGLCVPLCSNSRCPEVVESQLAMQRPLEKRLWQKIVVAKLGNQAHVLEILGKDAGPVRECESQVRSGDVTGRESVGAAAYFKALIPEGTRRDGPYSAPLDYGYGVLRAGLARETVTAGLLASHGIHHSSSLNPFNLVDDLIEPFRPVVDMIVLTLDLGGELTHAKKIELARVFEYAVLMGDRKTSVQEAISEEVGTLKRAIAAKNANELTVPALLELEKCALE